MTMHPRHQDSCTDVYQGLEELQVRGPKEVTKAIEASALRSGRNFYAQLGYALKLCMGQCSLDVEDERDVEGWQALVEQLEFQIHHGGEWIPCTVIFSDRFAERTQHSGRA